MVSVWPIYTGTWASYNDWGTTDWTNPTNVQWDTTSTATTCNIWTNGGTSYKLRCSNFGFSLASNTTVVWVFFEAERSAANNSRHEWNNIQIMKAWSETWTNKSDGSWITTTKQFTSWWWTTDLRGTTLSYTDINNSGFGVSLKILRNSTPSTTTSIFRVRATVYYTVDETTTIQEVSSIVDWVDIVLWYSSSFNDTTSTTDNININYNTSSEVNDNAVIWDNVSVLAYTTQSYTDINVISDNVILSQSTSILIVDDIIINEVVSTNIWYAINIWDDIVVDTWYTDEHTTDNYILVIDTVSILDNIEAWIDITYSIFDSVALYDEVIFPPKKIIKVFCSYKDKFIESSYVDNTINCSYKNKLIKNSYTNKTISNHYKNRFIEISF